MGLVIELIAFRPLRRSRCYDEHSREWSTLISSLALLLILQSLAQLYTFEFSDNQILRFPPEIFQSTVVTFARIEVRSISLVMFGVAIVLTMGTWWVVRFTQAGRAARAVVADPEAAVVGASAAMAGIAGSLIGVAFNSVDFLTGEAYLLRGFAVIVLGGIGSVVGTLAGGLLLRLAVHQTDDSPPTAGERSTGSSSSTSHGRWRDPTLRSSWPTSAPT